MDSQMFLPQEIVLEIATRLPAKSIGRFRCVSKQWRILLSQPDFIKTHFNRFKQNPSIAGNNSLIAVSNDSHSLYSINFKINHDHHLFDEMTVTQLTFEGNSFSSHKVNIDETASCDGLILFQNNEEKLVLINPTTRQIQELPTSIYALDPEISHTLYGLGYDSITDDYKVVTLSYYDAYYYEDYDDDDPNCTDVHITVYSVKNGTWKQAGSSPYDHAVAYPLSGVYVNGCLHWLANKSAYKPVIAAFDLHDEKFHEVSPPNLNCSRSFIFNYLIALGGCLCLYMCTGTSTHIWMMKEYGVQASWSKFNIRDDDESEFRLLCLLKKEQLVLLRNVDDDLIGNDVVLYDLEEGTFKDFIVHGISNNFCVGGAFLETLVSPYADGL
ncbi:unnamed protein product [Amaranthus hypochondriacus]